MTTIPTTKIKQPHVEQIHDLLEQALLTVSQLHAAAGRMGAEDLHPELEEVDYLIKTATQYLPPKQTKLPF